MFLLATPFIMISCDEDEQVLPREDFFVAFEGTFATISKNSTQTLDIPVYVAAEKGEQVTVNIGIKNDPELLENPEYEGYSFATENTDFEYVHGPVLTYSIGAGYDTLRISPIAGGTPGNLILDLYLQSNSADYKMGFFYGEQADSTSHDRFLVVFTE